MGIWGLSAKNILSLVHSRQATAQEVLDSFLSRTGEVEPRLGAYTQILEPDARFAAAKVDAAILRGEQLGLLAALPVAVKDNIGVIGAGLSCASKSMAGYVAPYDATCVKNLRAQNAVITGKTNMDEFAMGSSTETSAFGITHNPWDLNRVPGGSSGGSAAIVAAGMAPLALGSDTGGSIRQPASFTGICGLKPTYGLVSRYGVSGFASSMDTVGPMGATVWDCALALQAIAGPDVNDTAASRRDVISYTEGLGKSIKGIRIGVPEQFLTENIEADVQELFLRALDVMSQLGATVDYISMPCLEYAGHVYRVLSSCEASSNLSRHDGVRFGFRAQAKNLDDLFEETRSASMGDEVKRRIMLGTMLLSKGYYDRYYVRAAKARTALIHGFQKAFSSYDLLVSPTTPAPAFELGQLETKPAARSGDILTPPANLVGIPALSVPMGLVSREDSGLPCGLQIMGKPFHEATVLNVGYAYEEAAGKGLSEMRRRLNKERELV